MAFSASGHAARNALRLRVGVIHMSLQAKQATQAIFGCGGTCSASSFNCVIVCDSLLPPSLKPDQCLIAAVIAGTDAAATFLTPQCVRATAKGSGFNSASSKCSHLLSCSLRFLLSIITIVRDSSSPRLTLSVSRNAPRLSLATAGNPAAAAVAAILSRLLLLKKAALAICLFCLLRGQ